MDKDKLTKLLKLTASENDAEALVAVRKANLLLANEGTTWDEIIGGSNRVSIQVFDFTMTAGSKSPLDVDPATDPHRNATIINAMFNRLYAVPHDGSDWWQWLDSVKNQWDRHGLLTKAQYDGLRRSYARVMRASS